MRLSVFLWACVFAGYSFALAYGVTVEDLSPAPGAHRVCVDTPLYITFDQAVQPADSGVIYVYRKDGTLADSIDLADPESWKRPVGGLTLNYYPILVSDTQAAIYLHQPLDYGERYSIAVDPGVFLNANGDPSPAIEWRFSTRKKGPPEGSSELTVDAGGAGDFCTVQTAIDFVPENNTQPVTITVQAGMYTEIVYVNRNKPLITVRGTDRDSTVIQYANNANFNPSGRQLFGMDASDFTLENITLWNTTPKGGSQAEAFRGNNQRVVLTHVNLKSFQDTLWLQGTGFVTDSYIEGDVDFMWGYGTVFFQNSELKAVNPGYYTMIRNGYGQNGNVYVNCVLDRAPDLDDAVYLARINPDPVSGFPYSQVVYIHCAMDAHIRPVGWLLNTTPSQDCSQAPNIRFWEYNSTDLDGSPLDVSQRLPCSRQLTDDEAAQWSDPEFVLGWHPPDERPSGPGLRR